MGFPTKTDALAAGYLPARQPSIVYRAFEIKSVDVSGTRSIGYRYAVLIDEPWSMLAPGCPERPDLPQGRFGEAEPVWLTDDRNQVGQPGCFAVMYAPGVWETGVAQARRAIDAVLDARPALRDWIERYEAERDAEEARIARDRAERDARYEARRAARLAARQAGPAA